MEPTQTFAGGRWEIQLLGDACARNGDVVLARFPTRHVAALLARLALFPRRAHAREELAELLWPGAEPAAGRNRLRHALSTLRGLLEPAGTTGTVLQVDRLLVRLNPAAFDCDAAAFEACVRAGDVRAALALYRGELMPGFYDDWVLEERERLAALHARLESLDAPRHAPAARHDPPRRQLPGYLTTFFGRVAELATLAEAVAAHRLVTLSGPGGCGKTRLAIELCARVPGFDRVVFVGLAECRDPAQVVDHVRAALRLRPGASAALDDVVAALADERVLLLLDNFEQLAGEGGAAAVAALRERLPALRLLVTSRRVLQCAGEREIVLEPLPVPSVDDGLAAGHNPGVALFVDRARLVRADFRLGARNVESIVDVCLALEGLPLAIEIAASRVRTLSPREMGAALRRDVSALARTGPRAVRDGRHASLAATLAWSFRLLGPPARELLGALAVFRASWDAAAARAVSGRPDCDEQLGVLVADSLVAAQAPEDDVPPRFRLLASVRDFVRGQVPADAALGWRRRHRAHVLALAQAHAARHAALDERVLPDCIEALRTASGDGEAPAAVALALALAGHWVPNGASSDALSSLAELARDAPPGTAGLAALACLRARLLLQAGRPAEAEACAATALALAGDDAFARADARLTATNVAWVWRRDGAAVLADARASLRLAEAFGAGALRARAGLLLGAITLWHLDDASAADAFFARAQADFGAIGDERGALSSLPGRVACLQGLERHHEAIALASDGERRAVALQHAESQLLLLNRLSASFDHTRQFERSLEASRRQARLALRQGMVYHLAFALWNQCRPLARLRRPEDAARLMAFAERSWVEHFGALSADDLREVARVRRLVVAQAGARRWEAWRAQGFALAWRDGLALGGAIEAAPI